MSEDFEERLTSRLPQIAKHFGTPFHIYDEQGIREGVRQMKDAFIRNNIQFKNFFAVKALPKPAILKILKDEGCGFDCSSIPELRWARETGASADDIMFTSNNTSPEEFVEAGEGGGCIVNLDDDSLISKVPAPYPDLVCFRLNPGPLKTGDDVNPIIGNPTDAKYGVPHDRYISAYLTALKKFNASRIGQHTMIVSNERKVSAHLATLRIQLDFAAQLEKSTLLNSAFINVGGGIGTPYRLAQDDFNWYEYTRGAGKMLNEFESLYNYRPKIYMECGRYVTGPHGVLVNRVLNLYEKYDRKYVGVETAMPGIPRVAIYRNDDFPEKSAYHHSTFYTPDGHLRDGKTEKGNIVGSICEDKDRLGFDVDIPVDRKEGDFVFTHNSGAHCIVMASNYNGRYRPQELLMGADGIVRRICRAEDFEDLDYRNRGLEGREHMLQL